MSKEYNNIVLVIRYIDKINNNKYRNDFLDRIMYIY